MKKSGILLARSPAVASGSHDSATCESATF